LTCWAGEHARGAELLEGAVAAAREVGGRRELGNALWSHGKALLSVDPGRAAAAFAESLTIGRELDIPERIASSLWGLGATARLLGERQRAVPWLDEALAEARAMDHPLGIAVVLHELGRTVLEDGDLDRAGAIMTEALRHLREVALEWSTTQPDRGPEAILGAPWAVLGCLAGLARIEAARGRIDRAARLSGAIVGMQDTLEILPGEVHSAVFDDRVTLDPRSIDDPDVATAWAEGQTHSLLVALGAALEDDRVA
jgi:hypothetical protein